MCPAASTKLRLLNGFKQAGEDLDEDDDESEEDDAGVPSLGAAEAGQGGYARVPVNPANLERPMNGSFLRDTSVGERASLLGPGSRAGSKTRHRRTKTGPPAGTASVTQATLMVRP